MKTLYLLLLCVLLSGCATVQGIDDHSSIDLNSQTIYRDQWVRKSPLEVHVQPARQATYAPKALFIPFRVTQNMENSNAVGYSAARTVWQTWLTMQLFPAMEFTGDPTPYRRDRAVQLGRARGANIVIGGFVTYLYAGGTAGDTQIALQVEALDVSTGQVIWSMAQSALMPSSSKKDYIFFAVKDRLPTDPLHACTKGIAIDMGKTLQNWLSGPPPAMSDTDKMDQDVRDTLFPERNKVPAPRTGASEEQDQRSF